MVRMCEDCGKKWANYGEQGNTKRKWCGTCAKKHGGVRLGTRQMCEDCKEKEANYGEEGTTRRKWCGTCAKEHGGVRLGKKRLPDGSRERRSSPARKRRRRGVPAESAGPAAASRPQPAPLRLPRR